MRTRPNKSKIMTMWFGESEASMRALFFDELSRRDNKRLNYHEVGSKSTCRVLTSLVESTPARIILTLEVQVRE